MIASRLRRFQLSLFIAGAAALAGFAADAGTATPAGPPSSDPVVPAPRDRDYSWMPLAEWNRQHAAFSEFAAKGDVDLIFDGDSIISGAQWSETWKKTFAAYRSTNMGIGGDRTQNLLWRLENGEIGALKPKVVVVLIGTNNIFTTPRDVEDTARGIIAVAKKLNTAYPAAKILVLGVFPRDEQPSSLIRAKIKKINATVAAMDDGKAIFVRDIGDVFLEPDGTLPRTVSPDQIHLTEEGVRRWTEAMGPIVKQLMK